MGNVLRSLARNRPVTRLVAAYALFTLNEYSVWIAVLVYAYNRGGATAAGLVSVVQLVPAALCAPVMALVADRHPPALLLLGGFGAQAAGLMLAAVAVDQHWSPAVVYAGAVVAATALTAVRPAQAVMLPGLARTADELTAANASLAWVEAGGVAVSGLWTAGLLVAGVGQVLAASALLLTAAAWLVAVLPVTRLRSQPLAPASVWTDLRVGVGSIGRTPGAGTLVGLLGAQQVVVGALDVLFVVIAYDELHRGQSWVGYLNSAYGWGGVAAGGATLLLIGRRLPLPILVSAVVAGGSLAAVGFGHSVLATVALLTVLGAARSVLDMASRTLLQRSVAPDVLGRVFGLVEGTSMAALATGAILVPVLVAAGGAGTALVGVGLILPVVALASGRRALQLDRASRIPVVEITLLRGTDIFGRLPPATLESVARSLQELHVRSGAVLVREGAAGDGYFVIGDGRVRVTRQGAALRELGRGAGFGEIALLRDVPRTATVTAVSDAVVFQLGREAFLAAVTGHLPSREAADTVATVRLRNEARLS